MARLAGFEPATVGLEDRCSIQLSYRRLVTGRLRLRRRGPRRQPEHLVGVEGFEPPTLCSQSRCATRLRYTPSSLDAEGRA